MTQQIDVSQQRLSNLELLLIWEGRLNRSRLLRLFGLSQVRASEWIREVRDKHPDWVRWDTKTRSYYSTAEAYAGKRAANASQSEIAESLSKYLSLVGLPSAAQGESTESVVWTAFPDISVPPPRVFATLNNAIRMKRAVEITYMSMRNPTPHKRVISPHSLVRAGRRWHTRAFSATDQEFRDYALGRITQANLLEQASERGTADDVAWGTKVPVRLVAHPDLTPEQAKAIRLEYFSGTASRVDTCRGPLVSYFIQDIRAAIDTKTQRAPDYQLAVENIGEVSPWLFPR